MMTSGCRLQVTDRQEVEDGEAKEGVKEIYCSGMSLLEQTIDINQNASTHATTITLAQHPLQLK